MDSAQPNLHDAVLIFRSLGRTEAAVLLSQMDVGAAQQLLAAAATTCHEQNQRSLQSLASHLKLEIETQQTKATPNDTDSIEQLLNLSPAQIKTLLASVSTARWAPAISQASTELRQRILDNVAAPVAAILAKEFDACEADAASTAAAQANILAVAKRLRFVTEDARPRRRVA